MSIPNPAIIQSSAGLAADVQSMIEQTREGVARAVNAGMALLYWRIGKRVQIEVLQNQRAEYGKEILATLSRELVQNYGNGFSEKSLRRMIQFAEVFPDSSIVATLSRQLGWSHFKELIPLKEPLQRDFYAEMCRVERWSVRTLRKKIDSMLYERTALSKQPEAVAQAEIAKLRSDDQLTPALVFKDPYVVDSPRRKKARTCGAPRTRSIRHSCRGIPHRAAPPGAPAGETPQRNPAVTRPLRAERRNKLSIQHSPQ